MRWYQRRKPTCSIEVDMNGAGLLIGWKKAAHTVLCYAKTTIKTWAASSGLNWFYSLSFSPFRAFLMYC